MTSPRWTTACFHRDTIKKALAELDTLSEDFRMEVVEHKRGRKVEELQFRVISKPTLIQEGIASQSAAVFDLELVERIVDVGVKRSEAEDLYASTNETVLRAAVDHVEQRGKSDTLPPLKSPKAYLRDALKKQYAGIAESESKPAEPPAPPVSSLQEKLQRLREEWVHHKATEARARFLAMEQPEREASLARFEMERLPEIASPIAKAWRRDGVDSRIAGGTFNRWLSGVLWPGDVTDSDLLNFAMSRQT